MFIQFVQTRMKNDYAYLVQDKPWNFFQWQIFRQTNVIDESARRGNQDVNSFS